MGETVTLQGSADTGFLPMENAPENWKQFTTQIGWESDDVKVTLNTYTLTDPDGDFNSFGVQVDLDEIEIEGDEESPENKTLRSKTSWTVSFPYGTDDAGIDSNKVTSNTKFETKVKLNKVSDFEASSFIEALASAQVD